MNKNVKGGSKGVSIRTVLVLFLILSIAVFFVMGFVTFTIPIYNNRITSLSKEISDCQKEVSDIKDCREYLTRQARLYVENRDLTYVFSYYNEVNKTKRIENAIASLESRNLGEEADASLQNIVSYAERLMKNEAYAMKLALLSSGENTENLPEEIKNLRIHEEDEKLSPADKRSKARTYVFGREYVELADSLREEAELYVNHITDGFDDGLSDITHSLYVLMVIQRVCIGVMVILVATMFAFWVAFFMWPVSDYIKSIEGNRPFHVGGIRELRLLAKSYNKLYMHSAAEKTELLIRAESDSLTGLMNQRAFFQLKDELKDYKEPLALLVIDIDRFKQINDEYGHDMGDSMLKLVASELLKITNADDRVIRLGGDEFVVVVLNITLAESDRIKQKIASLNESLMRPEPDRPLLSVSVGVAFSEKGYNDELFHCADQAMYSVKRKGGGGLRVYDGTENLRAVIENGTPGNKKQKILLVDDSELNREFLSDILHDKYDIVAVENGFRAMDALESEGNNFCLILLDLIMPECDGFQVLDYMKKYRWSEVLPVIVISAENDPTLITRAYDMGITDYISRPFAANVVLKRVDNTVSLYLRHKRLAGLVFQQIQEQVDSYDRVLQSLCHIVEFRGEQRPSHIKNIDLITELLVDALMNKTSRYALTPSDARRIRRASVLHDIGKISVPEEILNKIGNFTQENFEIVKSHCTEGARMLEKLGNLQNDKFLLTAYEICRYHHERYDGRGYPDGLKGDDIPISAQIVSIADVYDALTSDRCYKNACSHEQALKMIYGGECGVFNPILLDCFSEIADALPLRLKESVEAINRRRENEYFSEEFYRHDELNYTNRFLSSARFETVRSEFFCKATTDRTFYYRSDTEELTLSSETAELLGVTELVIRKPLETLPKKTTVFDKASIATLKEYFSPQSPETSVTVNLKSGGVSKKYRVVVKSVWTNDVNPRFMGVVGFFQPA